MAMLKYWLWLTTRAGVRPEDPSRLWQHFGTPEQAYFADPAEYCLVEGLLPDTRTSLLDKNLDGAERVMEDCTNLGLRVLTILDADYPDRLKNIPKPPVVLYVKGKTFAFDEEVAIGVVGSRHPSVYGMKMADKLGRELARQGALVVSGIAQGLDAAALTGALKAGGPVVSVLAGGTNIIYPLQNSRLYEDVAAAGALMSEYPPGTSHMGAHFPVRNRIISGLCLGVLAVECDEHSGTMITVNRALEQDRDVFAIPGNADSPLSAGTNKLIQEGAALVTCGRDILREYEYRFPNKVRWEYPPAREPDRAFQRVNPVQTPPIHPVSDKKEVDKVPNRAYIDLSANREGLTDDQMDLLKALEGRPLLADDLVTETEIPAKRVFSALTMLQVRGIVTEGPGKRFASLVTVNK